MSGVQMHIGPGVAELRLNNPAKLNALTSQMLAELEARCASLESRRDIRCILLTAEGSRAFCVGADITEWGALAPMEFARQWIRNGHRVFDRIARLPVPTIAVLQSHAFGGGLELAAACDLRVMAPTATLALPETGVGIVPGWSGSQRLSRQMPVAVLKEMALTGRRLDADRAHQIGFVNAVSADPLAEARTIAGRITETAPEATEVAKYMLSAALGEDRNAMIEALGGAVLAGSPDKAEGVAAFREKRKPVFGQSDP